MTILTQVEPSVNGRSATLAEFVDDEARSYRARGTPEADFLAGQLERVAQLIRWTNATTSEEYADRLEIWEEDARLRAYERGVADGRGRRRQG